MKNLLFLSFVITFYFPPSIVYSQSAFISILNDVPLMSGLKIQKQTALIFDTPSGRIVEVAAVGKIPLLKVREFYADTLPQLGWRDVGKNIFSRDKEILSINLSIIVNRNTQIKFSITPEPIKP
ncbi:MAG: hypothetical protein HOK89_07585 [Rhodospirillaceae bacterium]|nr:hypothetical protein [Rhodospirillaceae bacterium]